MGGQQRRQFRFDGLLDQTPHPYPKMLVSAADENPDGSRSCVMASFVMRHILFSPENRGA